MPEPSGESSAPGMGIKEGNGANAEVARKNDTSGMRTVSNMQQLQAGSGFPYPPAAELEQDIANSSKGGKF